VVKTADNGGGTTCLQYDLLHRLTLKTYTGLNSAATPSKTFLYDSTSNPSITCASNQLGRLAEVSTSGGGIFGGADEGFCYDVVGNPTDYFQSDGPGIWTHSVESYFPTGIPQTLATATQPTITYGLDAMARIYSANASSGQNPILTGVSYNAAGLPTAVNFGSGDSSSYGWLNNIGPMNSAAFNVGTRSITDTLTWNANGTLQQLVIVDPFNTADAQTCTYSYDDLQRILTDDCGSKWGQTFNYGPAPFGNVTKSGSSSWSPAYDQATNRYLVTGSIAYDANGRLTQDPFDNPIGWDIDGNLITQSTTNIAYDGLDRSAGSVVNNVWTNYFYAPDGGLMGTVTNGGTIQKMFVPLPMSTAVYSGGALQQYRRNDWQGSVRVTTTPSKGVWSTTAYGAFGEGYGASGVPNKQFAGLTSDISSGTEQVSLSRRYHPGQGRWISPDSIIPDEFDPQTFNAYHYALNSPTNVTDPSGLTDCPQGKTCNCPIEGCSGVDIFGALFGWADFWGGDTAAAAKMFAASLVNSDFALLPGYQCAETTGDYICWNTVTNYNGAVPANNTNPPCGATRQFNQTASRVIAGGKALVNASLAAPKILAGALGELIPGLEVPSTYEIWNGFWQGVNAGENAMYAATGNATYQHQARSAIAVGTASGLLTYGFTGNVELAAIVGSFENATSPVDAGLTLVELGEKATTGNVPCQGPTHR
jgi:RHS repeat-associated protein